MARYKIDNLFAKYCLNYHGYYRCLASLLKKGDKFNEIELKEFIRITTKFFNSVSSIPNKPSQLFGDLLVEDFEQDLNGLTFYKFVSKEIYDNYICKGKHQLGSLKFYREIEKKESKDEKEGFCNLIILSLDRQIFTSVISGFNYYLFCGSKNLDQFDYMVKNFGDIILKIENISSFANKIQKSIGAKSWQLKRIIYSDYKAYRVYQVVEDINGASPNLSEEMFRYLQKYSVLPSIFCKPTCFSPENELRLVFEMDKNVKKKLSFDNLGLLDEIECLK